MASELASNNSFSENEPLVSVVVPTYNSGDCLVQTITSLTDQTYANWEVICVDDGSSDNTIDLLKELSQADKRVKYYVRDSEAKGGSVCRNIGIKKAQGEFIIFLDSDDLLDNHCIRQRVAFALAEKNFDLYIFKMQIFYKTPGDSSELAVDFSIADPLKGFLLMKYPYPWHTTSPLWRKDFLAKIGAFNESYPRLQDPELHTKTLLTAGVKLKICKEEAVDCFYRVAPKTSKVSFSKRHLSGFYLFVSDFIPKVKTFDDENNTNYSQVFNESFKNAFKGIMLRLDLLPYLNKILAKGFEYKVLSVPVAINIYAMFFSKMLYYYLTLKNRD